MLRPNERLSIREVVDDIIKRTEELESEWKNSHGWAPKEAADLLEASRLDWLVSLSYTLRIWIRKSRTNEDADGRLILAWANLGTLVEGTMKFFLCVYASDYQSNVTAKQATSIYKNLWNQQKATVKEPDGLVLNVLREFFCAEVWTDRQKNKWNDWVKHIGDRRNAIHAYQHRDIGTFKDFRHDVRRYREFLDEVTGQLPDPPPPPDHYY